MNYKINDEQLTKLLSDKYDKEKDSLNNLLENINANLLKEYRRMFPYHFISLLRLKYFLHKLNKLNLIPEKDEYIKILKNHEFFGNAIFISFESKVASFNLILPYAININKLTSIINRENTILQNSNPLD